MADLDYDRDLRETTPGASKCHAFSCHFPGCDARYRRKEHLNRHRTRHSRQQSFSCSTCGRTFGRSDTLRRHVQKRHKIFEPSQRATRACESCHAGKTRCEGGVPCDECLRRKIQCSFEDQTGSGEMQRRKSPTHPESRPGGQPQLRSEKTSRCIDLYFRSFHPHWCFIHKGTFDLRHETTLLVQSMAVLGLWASGEQSSRSSAVELHNKLDLAIREQRDKWDASEVEAACSACFWPLPTYQAILLHIIFAFVLNNREDLDLDLKVSLSAADLGLLESLVRSCRKLGMFYYPNILARYQETDPASFVWVGIEEVKRFNLAVYKVCGRVSGSSIRARSGIGTDGASLLTASELQFPLPSNHPLWNAVSKDEWTANTKDEGLVSLDDDCQASWISNFAVLLGSLDL